MNWDHLAHRVSFKSIAQRFRWDKKKEERQEARKKAEKEENDRMEHPQYQQCLQASQHVSSFTADTINALHFAILVKPNIFSFYDIRALWLSGLSTRAPECQKIKNGGLDQYGAERFKQQQSGTAGVEGANKSVTLPLTQLKS